MSVQASCSTAAVDQLKADRIRQPQPQPNQSRQPSSTSASPLPFLLHHFCRGGRDLLPATCRRLLLPLTTCSTSDDSQSNATQYQQIQQHSTRREAAGEEERKEQEKAAEGEGGSNFEQAELRASELLHLAPRQTAVQSYGSLLLSAG